MKTRSHTHRQKNKVDVSFSFCLISSPLHTVPTVLSNLFVYGLYSNANAKRTIGEVKERS